MFKKRREFIIMSINLVKTRVSSRKLLKTENIKVGQSLSLKHYSPVLLKTQARVKHSTTSEGIIPPSPVSLIRFY